ncbi:MAG: glycosyltransferase family 4 protein [Alphaproteobacteria bacterium]
MTQTILQILPSLKQGGVETGTIEIASALQKAGIPNLVVSNGGEMVAQLDKIGVKHIQLPLHSKNPFRMWLNSKKLAQIVRENDVALMHVRSRAPAWSVKWASQKTGIPFISSYHGMYGIQPVLKKLYNRVMLQGLCTIAVSESVKKHLMAVYHYPENKIHVIYRGADLKRFNPDYIPFDKAEEFAQKKQIPLDKPVITLVGRLSKMKGQNLLLEALSKMRHQELTCLLVGGKANPEYEQLLKDEIAKLPGTITVRTLSASALEIPLVYMLSDVVVSASVIPETFGRTIAEANAMKKIVIAFNHGGPTEIIQDQKTGFLIPVSDTDSLAQKLDQVLEMNSSQKKKMEEAARERIEECFSIQKMCQKTLELYQEILK